MPAKSSLLRKSVESPEDKRPKHNERRVRHLDRGGRALEQDGLRFLAIADQADLGVLVFDSSLKLVRANPAFMLRFWPGSNPAALLGMDCHRLTCPQSQPC